MSEEKREITMEELNSILPNEGWVMETVHCDAGVDLRTPSDELVFAPWSLIVEMGDPSRMKVVHDTTHKTTDRSFYGRCLEAFRDSPSEEGDD